jgi:HTH-type transcriptional regulator / antitoxin HigA
MMISTLERPSYLDLLTAFPPRSIHTVEQLAATQKVLDALIDKGALSLDEWDYLNVLGTLVHEYEERHCPMPDIYGVELLKVLIEEHGLRQKDLVPIFKTESIVSAVLAGERNLTVNHIQKLAAFFHVSPAVFMKVVQS